MAVALRSPSPSTKQPRVVNRVAGNRAHIFGDVADEMVHALGLILFGATGQHVALVQRLRSEPPQSARHAANRRRTLISSKRCIFWRKSSAKAVCMSAVLVEELALFAVTMCSSTSSMLRSPSWSSSSKIESKSASVSSDVASARESERARDDCCGCSSEANLLRTAQRCWTGGSDLREPVNMRKAEATRAHSTWPRR